MTVVKKDAGNRVTKMTKQLRRGVLGPAMSPGRWGVRLGNDWYRAGGPETAVHEFPNFGEADFCAGQLNRATAQLQDKEPRGVAEPRRLFCSCPNPENRMSEHLSQCAMASFLDRVDVTTYPETMAAEVVREACPHCIRVETERELIAERCLFAEKRVANMSERLGNVLRAFRRLYVAMTEVVPPGAPGRALDEARQYLDLESGTAGSGALTYRSVAEVLRWLRDSTSYGGGGEEPMTRAELANRIEHRFGGNP